MYPKSCECGGRTAEADARDPVNETNRPQRGFHSVTEDLETTLTSFTRMKLFPSLSSPFHANNHFLFSLTPIKCAWHTSETPIVTGLINLTNLPFVVPDNHSSSRLFDRSYADLLNISRRLISSYEPIMLSESMHVSDRLQFISISYHLDYVLPLSESEFRRWSSEWLNPMYFWFVPIGMEQKRPWLIPWSCKQLLLLRAWQLISLQDTSESREKL